MKWTNGHIWMAENIKVNEALGDKSYFMYKYVVIESHNKQFERGLDRIADLKLLAHTDSWYNNSI